MQIKTVRNNIKNKMGEWLATITDEETDKIINAINEEGNI